MPKSQINVFYMISLICTLILICYVWFVLLPQFESLIEYQSIRASVLLIIAMLFAAAALQVFLLLKPPKQQERPSESK